jgi:predicted enzyme related to lactoylglutathione lyase
MRTLFAALMLGALLLAPHAALAQTQPATPAAAAGERPRIMIVRVFVTDMDRSERFYRTVFGWGPAQAFGPGNRMFGAPSPTAPSLLLVQTREPRTNNASFALAVNDTAAVMNAAEGAGGAVQRPASSQGHGMPIGFITDPDGAQIEVIQLPQAPPAR